MSLTITHTDEPPSSGLSAWGEMSFPPSKSTEIPIRTARDLKYVFLFCSKRFSLRKIFSEMSEETLLDLHVKWSLKFS
jgi:hypothetical protein